MSLAPEFAPEVLIPERARRSMQPAQRPARGSQRASAGQNARALLVAPPRTGAPHGLATPGVRPHRVAAPRRHSAPASAPATAPDRLPVVAPEFPSTGWSEPRRVAVAAHPPVTLILRRAPEASTAPALNAAPLRVTRRGTLVRAAAVALIALGLVITAWLSAPPSSSSTGDAPPMPTVVTVEAGDTLWSLAGRLAPTSDPREVVSNLRRINGLDSVTLQPGQVLRTR
jgi:hypothetical protein